MYFILFSEVLRADIYDWLHTNSIYYYYYYYTISIIYGVISEHIQDFLINNILILGKFYIYKYKYMKVKSRFYVS